MLQTQGKRPSVNITPLVKMNYDPSTRLADTSTSPPVDQATLVVSKSDFTQAKRSVEAPDTPTEKKIEEEKPWNYGKEIRRERRQVYKAEHKMFKEVVEWCYSDQSGEEAVVTHNGESVDVGSFIRAVIAREKKVKTGVYYLCTLGRDDHIKAKSLERVWSFPSILNTEYEVKVYVIHRIGYSQSKEVLIDRETFYIYQNPKSYRLNDEQWNILVDAHIKTCQEHILKRVGELNEGIQKAKSEKERK